MTARRKVLTQAQVGTAIKKLAEKIYEQMKKPGNEWALVGIQRRGVPLAERLEKSLEELGASPLSVGTLDITFYRDDMGEAPLNPVVQDTNVPFDVNGKTILLVDDVLYTGRTIRCALDELMDFGRPNQVLLAVLVDRGLRELPIHADFAGESVSTNEQERVEVHLEEVDGEDAVWLNQSEKSEGRSAK